MQALKQNMRNKLSGIGAFCDLIWFFCHTKRERRKTNNRMKSKKHNKDNAGKKQRKQKNSSEWKMALKRRTQKSENPSFPVFLMKEPRVNKRPGGGIFYRAWPTSTFLDPLFWGSCFEG